MAIPRQEGMLERVLGSIAFLYAAFVQTLEHVSFIQGEFTNLLAQVVLGFFKLQVGVCGV